MHVADLESLEEKVISGKNNRSSETSPQREADMGGSGDAHEINWGDVTDVVREAVKHNFEEALSECLSNMEMEQIDEGHRSLQDLPEYNACIEASEELADRVTDLLRKAHLKNIIAKSGTPTL